MIALKPTFFLKGSFQLMSIKVDFIINFLGATNITYQIAKQVTLMFKLAILGNCR